MRIFLALVALVVAVGPAGAAEIIPSGLTVKVGMIRRTDIGVDVNFTIINEDSESIGVIFTTCTALDSDGQPKASADASTHNVKPGETVYGQAQFDEGEATVKDRFTCRIDQISR